MPRLVHQDFIDRYAGGAASPATEEELHFLELDLVTLLPQSYCEFMKDFGAVSTPAVLQAVSTSEDDSYPDLHSISSCDASIDMTKEAWAEGMAKALIAFGRDSLGNLLCFERSYADTRPADAAVWIYELDFSEVRLISDTFDGLLESYLALGRVPAG